VTDSDLLAEVERLFGASARPDHFTNFTHCSECAQHDELLRSRRKGELRAEDVSYSGWDPICFVSYEAFRYLLPDLVRLALLDPDASDEWSFPNLLFHLTYEARENEYLNAFSPDERAAVATFLRHMAETRRDALERYCDLDDTNDAVRLWQISA